MDAHGEVVVLGFHILGVEIDVPVLVRAELEVDRLVLNKVRIVVLPLDERMLHPAGSGTIADLLAAEARVDRAATPTARGLRDITALKYAVVVIRVVRIIDAIRARDGTVGADCAERDRLQGLVRKSTSNRAVGVRLAA